MDELIYNELPEELLQNMWPPVLKMFTSINDENSFTLLAGNRVYKLDSDMKIE